MEYTLYAPNNITMRTADLGDAAMLLALPKLARFVPSNVLANPDVIANRSDIVAADSPVFIKLSLAFDSGEVEDIRELESNVATWAKRCRLAGIRGHRLCVVSEPEDDGDTVTFTVLIGTVVFYNERRATVGVSLDDDELRDDLSNLFGFVPVNPTVERIDEDGCIVQVLPQAVAAASDDASNTAGDPTQDMAVVPLEQVVLSLLRLGTRAAPLLVAGGSLTKDELRDQLDNLQLELATLRAQMD